MRKKISLFITIFTICTACSSYAAFPVTHHTVTNSSVIAPVAITKTAESNNIYKKKSSFRTRVANAFSPRNELLNPIRRKSDTVGLLSLIFGILGLVPLYFIYFSVAAVVLGAIGLSHKERFSLAGLILGILGIAFSVLYVIILVSLL